MRYAFIGDWSLSVVKIIIPLFFRDIRNFFIKVRFFCEKYFSSTLKLSSVDELAQVQFYTLFWNTRRTWTRLSRSNTVFGPRINVVKFYDRLVGGNRFRCKKKNDSSQHVTRWNTVVEFHDRERRLCVYARGGHFSLSLSLFILLYKKVERKEREEVHRESRRVFQRPLSAFAVRAIVRIFGSRIVFTTTINIERFNGYAQAHRYRRYYLEPTPIFDERRISGLSTLKNSSVIRRRSVDVWFLQEETHNIAILTATM